MSGRSLLIASLAVAGFGFAPRNVTLTIKNPVSAILVGQSYTFEAEATPPGDTFTWKVMNGTTKVTPTTGTGPTFTITGVAASGSLDDVRVQVSYKGNEERCRLTVVSIRLKSLTFGGAGARMLTPDGGGAAYASRHWLDQDDDGVATNTTGDRRFPVLYQRSTRVTVTLLTAAVAPKDFVRAAVDVRGAGPDTHGFTGRGAIDKGVLTVSAAMVADRAVRDTVWFYDLYAVDWQAALVANAFGPIGRSDNRLYVSFAQPELVTIPETVAHLACAPAAGANSAQRALDLMWAEFTDRDVRRKPIDGFNKQDGVRLGYWRPPATVQQTLPQMLASPTGNGACGAWAELLIEMTRVHGVRHPQSRMVEITADPGAVAAAAPKPDGFLVKSWAFTHELVTTGANGLNDSNRAPDDVELFGKGRGFPYSVCITAGADRKLDSKPANDDEIFGAMIHTGPDGVCDTRADPKDLQPIAPTRGQPNAPCLLGGANDRVDSGVKPDDRKVTTAKGAAPYPFVIGQSAVNLPGIGGQDNREPPESFFNHFIVLALGRFYDPSYGAGPFAAENAHENAASDGLKRGALARRNDPNKQELQYRRK